MNDVAVLEGSRFGFVAVTNEVNGFLVSGLDEAPFHSGRKSCASPSAQARPLYLIGYLGRLFTEGFPEGLVAAIRKVFADGGIPSLTVNIPENKALFQFMGLCGGVEVGRDSRGPN